ncbi:hypothetical protein YC2023_099725 [Brassica napus]
MGPPSENAGSKKHRGKQQIAGGIGQYFYKMSTNFSYIYLCPIFVRTCMRVMTCLVSKCVRVLSKCKRQSMGRM